MFVYETDNTEVEIDSRLLAKLDRGKIRFDNLTKFVNWILDESVKDSPKVKLKINGEALRRLREKKAFSDEQDSEIIERLVRQVFGI